MSFIEGDRFFLLMSDICTAQNNCVSILSQTCRCFFFFFFAEAMPSLQELLKLELELVKKGL